MERGRTCSAQCEGTAGEPVVLGGSVQFHHVVYLHHGRNMYPQVRSIVLQAVDMCLAAHFNCVKAQTPIIACLHAHMWTCHVNFGSV